MFIINMDQKYFSLQIDSQMAAYSLAVITVTLVHYIVINFLGGKHRTHFS